MKLLNPYSNPNTVEENTVIIPTLQLNTLRPWGAPGSDGEKVAGLGCESFLEIEVLFAKVANGRLTLNKPGHSDFFRPEFIQPQRFNI